MQKKVSKIILILLFTQNLSAQTNNYKVNQITFTPLQKNNLAYLQQFLTTTVGETANAAILAEDLERLRRLTGVANATTKIDTIQNTINILFEIEEAKTFYPIFKLGRVTDNFWWLAGAAEYNFLKKGQTLIGWVMSNDKQPNAKIYYENNRVNLSTWGYAIDLSHTASIEPLYFPETIIYKYANTGIGASGIKNFGYYHRLTFGTNFFREKYEKLPEFVTPQSPGPNQLALNKLLTKMKFEINRVNYDYYSRSGRYLTLLAQHVYTFDKQTNFLSLTFEGIRYWRPYSSGNIALRLRAAIASNGFSPFAPFVLDSQTNIRGAGNRVDRGTAQLILNLEFRQTVFDIGNWAGQVVLFTDAGNWRNPGGQIEEIVDPESLRLFGGGGLRLINKKIFRFIFRFDYGFDLMDSNQRGPVLGFDQYF